MKLLEPLRYAAAGDALRDFGRFRSAYEQTMRADPEGI
jgi:hypothetical protein